uniref:Kinesin family member 26A n=1 Tax=Hucho hucho TaxID=62062 RepID=A0A4W5JPV9_9TELE
LRLEGIPRPRRMNSFWGNVEGCPSGESPFPLDLNARKILHSSEYARCNSRPPPEGAGSVTVSESERRDGKGSFCQQCQLNVTELKRQALFLVAGPGMDPGYAAFLFDQLQVPGSHEGCCQVCSTPLHQLRQEALHTVGAPPAALTLSHNMPALPSTTLSGQPHKLTLSSSSAHVRQPSKAHGCPQGSSVSAGPKTSVQVTVGGGQLTGTLGSVTIQAQQYLEGMWSISRVNNFLPQLSPVQRDVPVPTSEAPVPSSNCSLTPSRQRSPVQLGQCDVTPSAPGHTSTPISTQSASAAASFFIRAAQKLNLSSKRKKHQPPSLLHPGVQEPSIYPTNFSGILQLSPPPAPPCLLRAVSKVKENPGMGKVKVMMRICPSLEDPDSSESMSFLKVDPRKKQLTLYDPSVNDHANSGHRRATVAVPKIFAFDAVFTQDASQAEVCLGTVSEVIQSVVNGADGCIFCFGHVKLGKTFTMIGKDGSTQNLGIVPCAISWLFKLINERKEKTGTRFSVRVSAVEICGKDEALKDLLSEVSTGSAQDGQSPGVYLREDPICGTQLQNQSELRAPTAEKAAFFLDAAIAARSTSRPDSDEEERRNSHMLFTLHIYQYRMEKSGKGGMSGGRSRLHLIDLGSCEKVLSKSRDGGGGLCLSLTALGNVIMALANGAKHVPYRDSKLTMLLRESLGNINCRTTMIAHISDSPANYTDSLTTIQLASRIHRMRKKKSKYASSSSGGESSCEEGRIRRPPHLRPFHPRTVALDPDLPSLLSDPDYSSSSEQSCDTVIYVGPGGAAISDRELSDNEGPPTFVPIIPSLNRKRSGKEGPLDRDHFFKCNTFAELQERLECIDGSEEPTEFVGEGRGSQASPKMDSKAKECPGSVSPKTVTKASSSQENISPKLKVYFNKKPLPKPAPPPPQQRDSRRGNREAEERSPTRMPPVGMSHQVGKQGESGDPFLDRTQTRGPVEVCQLRSTLRERCLDRDILRATVTLQQPVELNGEDELVFTVVEELSIGSIIDNGRPSSIISFNSDCSLQAIASGSRPVSIISSINDEFDAYTSAVGGAEVNIEVLTPLQDDTFVCVGSRGSSISSWLSEVSVCTLESERLHSADVFLPQTKHIGPDATFYLDSLGIAASSKLSLTKCPLSPESTKGSLRFPSKTAKVNSLSSSSQPSQGPYIVHSSLPKKVKPTSSIAYSSSSSRELQRQEVKQEDPWQLSGIPCRKAGVVNSNGVPRPPKVQGSTSAQRVVDGCEKSTSKKAEPPSKMPQLRRGATTLGTVPVIHVSPETKATTQNITTTTNIFKFSSLGKNGKANRQQASMLPKPGGTSPPPPPVRKSSLDQKNRPLLPQSALKSAYGEAGRPKLTRGAVSEDELEIRCRGDSNSLKISSLRGDYTPAKATSSLRARGDASRQHYGSQMSLERCDSMSMVGSKPTLSRENSGASLGCSKSSRSIPRFGVPNSTSSPIATSPTSPCCATGALGKPGQVKGSVNPRALGVVNGSKARSLSVSNSKGLSSSTKSLAAPATRNPNANLPPTGKTSAPRATAAVSSKPGRGTIMGTKHAMRAANSRVSELASGSTSGKHLRGSGDSDSGNDSGVNLSDDKSPVAMLPSPYSKITAPRRPQRYSSGHGSDNSSVLSGELPPAMGRTALFYHSGGSSGYESMIRDSEATGSASSAHDSMSESGMSSSGRPRTSKSPKKRNGLQRRRLIPAPLPDTSSLGKKAGTAGQWVDLPPMSGPLKEPFEIKVYEIDDVERLQSALPRTSPTGLLYFNSKLKVLERRQQQIRELKVKHEALKEELEDTKTRLMMDPCKWIGEFEVDQDLDKESQEYLQALGQVTEELEFCVNLCKSRVMMVTCFDISVASPPDTQEGLREVEV